MAASNINIRVDSGIKGEAQELFASLGLDMTTAINIFLRKCIQQRGIPFPVAEPPARKRSKPGGREGKSSTTYDFEEPQEGLRSVWDEEDY